MYVCACVCVRLREVGVEPGRGRGGGLVGGAVWITVFRLPDMPTILCTCHPSFQFYHHRHQFICDS